MLLNTPIKLGKPGPGAHVLDQLAAYLDYELPEPARAAVREHLRGCPQCENELATLRAAKQLLRDLPTAVPSRSFKLNPDQVGALTPRPATPGRVFGLPRLALALRLASALCCLLLLPLLGTSALGSGSPVAMREQGQRPSFAAAVEPTFLPEATTAAAAAPPAPAAIEAAAAPTASAPLTLAGLNTAPTATAAVAAAVDGLMVATPTTAAGIAESPISPTFGSAADAQHSLASPDAGMGGAQSSAALNSAPQPTTLPSAAPAAKVLVTPNAAGDVADSGALTTPATGAATTQQLTPPPPTAESPSLLPWEIGLALAALVFALTSIPVARRAR